MPHYSPKCCLVSWQLPRRTIEQPTNFLYYQRKVRTGVSTGRCSKKYTSAHHIGGPLEVLDYRWRSLTASKFCPPSAIPSCINSRIKSCPCDQLSPLQSERKTILIQKSDFTFMLLLFHALKTRYEFCDVYLSLCLLNTYTD